MPADTARLALAAAIASAPFAGHAGCRADVTPINFGAYDVFTATALRSTATITVTCDLAPPPLVTVGIGPSGNSSVAIPRLLRGPAGGGDIQYNVFTDPALGQVWGDGVSGGTPVTLRVFKNRPEVLTVYGAVPPGQDGAAGTYFDNLPVTLVW